VVAAGAEVVAHPPVAQPPVVHPVEQPELQLAGAELQQVAAGAQQLVRTGAQQDVCCTQQCFVFTFLHFAGLQQRLPASAPFTNRNAVAKATAHTKTRRLMLKLP
jgi:hypothetical protein